MEPAAEAIDEAARVIRAGGTVVFPTDTLYGLAVDPFNGVAVERLFEVKGRAPGQAIALVAADVAQVEQWFESSPVARRLGSEFWPGPLTLLLRVRTLGPGTETPRAYRLATGIAAADGTVGVRVPDHAVARALCRLCGHPLTATSANLTGEPPTADPAGISDALAARIDLLVDAGTTPGGRASTIVEATATSLRLVRAGALDWDTIQRCASEP